MKRLEHRIFFKAKEILPNQDEEVYELLHYVGEQLPERFDSEDLADVLTGIVNTSILFLHRFPFKWMQDNPKLVLEHLKQVPVLIENVCQDENLVHDCKKICDKVLQTKNVVE